MTPSQIHPYPQLTHHLALYHPLLLTVPNWQGWLSGSSFTSGGRRGWLQLCEILVLLLAAAFEPSPLTLLLLRQCFTLLKSGEPLGRSLT
ncbi:MAG: hypothetical protein AAGG51_30350 [Cyanobacteria bacterium P01_G01_bin.54]